MKIIRQVPLLLFVFLWNYFLPVHPNALLEPDHRGIVWTKQHHSSSSYNYMGINCGGAGRIKRNNGNCGLCGDAFNGPRYHEYGGKYSTGVIAHTYRRGERYMNVKILLNSNQNGYFEFRLCEANGAAETLVCFNTHLLKTNEGRLQGNATRYFVHSFGYLTLNVNIPTGLVCEHCVLQWKYVTAKTFGKTKAGRYCLGCGPQETYVNCADVKILGWEAPTTLPPTTAPTTMPEATTPEFLVPSTTTTLATTTPATTTQATTTPAPKQKLPVFQSLRKTLRKNPDPPAHIVAKQTSVSAVTDVDEGARRLKQTYKTVNQSSQPSKSPSTPTLNQSSKPIKSQSTPALQAKSSSSVANQVTDSNKVTHSNPASSSTNTEAAKSEASSSTSAVSSSTSAASSQVIKVVLLKQTTNGHTSAPTKRAAPPPQPTPFFSNGIKIPRPPQWSPSHFNVMYGNNYRDGPEPIINQAGSQNIQEPVKTTTTTVSNIFQPQPDGSSIQSKFMPNPREYTMGNKKPVTPDPFRQSGYNNRYGNFPIRTPFLLTTTKKMDIDAHMPNEAAMFDLSGEYTIANEKQSAYGPADKGLMADFTQSHNNNAPVPSASGRYSGAVHSKSTYNKETIPADQTLFESSMFRSHAPNTKQITGQVMADMKPQTQQVVNTMHDMHRGNGATDPAKRPRQTDSSLPDRYRGGHFDSAARYGQTDSNLPDRYGGANVDHIPNRRNGQHKAASPDIYNNNNINPQAKPTRTVPPLPERYGGASVDHMPNIRNRQHKAASPDIYNNNNIDPKAKPSRTVPPLPERYRGGLNRRFGQTNSPFLQKQQLRNDQHSYKQFTDGYKAFDNLVQTTTTKQPDIQISPTTPTPEKATPRQNRYNINPYARYDLSQKRKSENLNRRDHRGRLITSTTRLTLGNPLLNRYQLRSRPTPRPITKEPPFFPPRVAIRERYTNFHIGDRQVVRRKQEPVAPRIPDTTTTTTTTPAQTTTTTTTPAPTTTTTTVATTTTTTVSPQAIRQAILAMAAHKEKQNAAQAEAKKREMMRKMFFSFMRMMQAKNLKTLQDQKKNQQKKQTTIAQKKKVAHISTTTQREVVNSNQPIKVNIQTTAASRTNTYQRSNSGPVKLKHDKVKAEVSKPKTNFNIGKKKQTVVSKPRDQFLKHKSQQQRKHNAFIKQQRTQNKPKISQNQHTKQQMPSQQTTKPMTFKEKSSVLQTNEQTKDGNSNDDISKRIALITKQLAELRREARLRNYNKPADNYDGAPAITTQAQRPSTPVNNGQDNQQQTRNNHLPNPAASNIQHKNQHNRVNMQHRKIQNRINKLQENKQKLINMPHENKQKPINMPHNNKQNRINMQDKNQHNRNNMQDNNQHNRINMPHKNQKKRVNMQDKNQHKRVKNRQGPYQPKPIKNRQDSYPPNPYQNLHSRKQIPNKQAQKQAMSKGLQTFRQKSGNPERNTYRPLKPINNEPNLNQKSRKSHNEPKPNKDKPDNNRRNQNRQNKLNNGPNRNRQKSLNNGQTKNRPPKPNYIGPNPYQPLNPVYNKNKQNRPPKPDFNGNNANRPPKPDFNGNNAIRPPKPDFNGNNANRPPKPDFNGNNVNRPPKPDYNGNNVNRPPKPDYNGNNPNRPPKPDYNGNTPNRAAEPVYNIQNPYQPQIIKDPQIQQPVTKRQHQQTTPSFFTIRDMKAKMLDSIRNSNEAKSRNEVHHIKQTHRPPRDIKSPNMLLYSNDHVYKRTQTPRDPHPIDKPKPTQQSYIEKMNPSTNNHHPRNGAPEPHIDMNLENKQDNLRITEKQLANERMLQLKNLKSSLNGKNNLRPYEPTSGVEFLHTKRRYQKQQEFKLQQKLKQQEQIEQLRQSKQQQLPPQTKQPPPKQKPKQPPQQKPKQPPPPQQIPTQSHQPPQQHTPEQKSNLPDFPFNLDLNKKQDGKRVHSHVSMHTHDHQISAPDFQFNPNPLPKATDKKVARYPDKPVDSKFTSTKQSLEAKSAVNDLHIQDHNHVDIQLPINSKTPTIKIPAKDNHAHNHAHGPSNSNLKRIDPIFIDFTPDFKPQKASKVANEPTDFQFNPDFKPKGKTNDDSKMKQINFKIPAWKKIDPKPNSKEHSDTHLHGTTHTSKPAHTEPNVQDFQFSPLKTHKTPKTPKTQTGVDHRAMFSSEQISTNIKPSSTDTNQSKLKVPDNSHSILNEYGSTNTEPQAKQTHANHHSDTPESHATLHEYGNVVDTITKTSDSKQSVSDKLHTIPESKTSAPDIHKMHTHPQATIDSSHVQAGHGHDTNSHMAASHTSNHVEQFGVIHRHVPQTLSKPDHKTSNKHTSINYKAPNNIDTKSDPLLSHKKTEENNPLVQKLPQTITVDTSNNKIKNNNSIHHVPDNKPNFLSSYQLPHSEQSKHSSLAKTTVNHVPKPSPIPPSQPTTSAKVNTNQNKRIAHAHIEAQAHDQQPMNNQNTPAIHSTATTVMNNRRPPPARVMHTTLDKFVNRLTSRMASKVTKGHAKGIYPSIKVVPLSKDSIMTIIRNIAMGALRDSRQGSSANKRQRGGNFRSNKSGANLNVNVNHHGIRAPVLKEMQTTNRINRQRIVNEQPNDKGFTTSAQIHRKPLSIERPTHIHPESRSNYRPSHLPEERPSHLHEDQIQQQVNGIAQPLTERAKPVLARALPVFLQHVNASGHFNPNGKASGHTNQHDKLTGHSHTAAVQPDFVFNAKHDSNDVSNTHSTSHDNNPSKKDLKFFINPIHNSNAVSNPHNTGNNNKASIQDFVFNPKHNSKDVSNADNHAHKTKTNPTVENQHHHQTRPSAERHHDHLHNHQQQGSLKSPDNTKPLHNDNNGAKAKNSNLHRSLPIIDPPKVRRPSLQDGRVITIQDFMSRSAKLAHLHGKSLVKRRDKQTAPSVNDQNSKFIKSTAFISDSNGFLPPIAQDLKHKQNSDNSKKDTTFIKTSSKPVSVSADLGREVLNRMRAIMIARQRNRGFIKNNGRTFSRGRTGNGKRRNGGVIVMPINRRTFLKMFRNINRKDTGR